MYVCTSERAWYLTSYSMGSFRKYLNWKKICFRVLSVVVGGEEGRSCMPACARVSSPDSHQTANQWHMAHTHVHIPVFIHTPPN